MNRRLRSCFVKAERQIDIESAVIYKVVTIVCIQGIISVQFNGLFFCCSITLVFGEHFVIACCKFISIACIPLATEGCGVKCQVD